MPKEKINVTPDVTITNKWYWHHFLILIIGLFWLAYCVLQCANDTYEFENHSEIPKNNY